MKEERKDISNINPTTGVWADAEDIRTDAIGGFVPAIPTKENDDFHGHFSTPVEAHNWWKRLPLR